MPGVSVSGGEFHLSLDASCLIHSSVCVNDIGLKDVSVVVDSSKMAPASPEKPAEESSSGDISTPYPIVLRHLGLDNVNLKIDDTAISLGSFSSGIHWQGRQLTLTPTRIENLLLALPKAKQPQHRQPPGRLPYKLPKSHRQFRQRPEQGSRWLRQLRSLLRSNHRQKCCGRYSLNHY